MKDLRRLLPAKLLTRLAGGLAASRQSLIKTPFIHFFAKAYKIDMSLAQRPSLSDYHSFNDFFTRELKPEARPIAATSLICPADGAISQIGAIEGDQLLQAKGVSYSLEALLADADLAMQFINGQFATVYLSPRDYHRVHMPFLGKLVKTHYVPGRLFSVDDRAAAHIPGLFARNERVVCEFDTEFGPAVVIMVAALIVGGMSLSFAGRIGRQAQFKTTDYRSEHITLEKGEELGRFYLGSTAIIVLPKGAPALDSSLQAGQSVTMGQAFSAANT